MTNYFNKDSFNNYTINDLSDPQVWVKSDISSTSGKLMLTDENGVDHSVSEIAARLDKIEERLSILDDPSPEQLAKHEMLREAYKKYRFIEELIGKESE